MCAAGDLTAAATIRGTAMRLFAERGVQAVSVRDIAAAAGVSPSLVIHHYRSKDGLRAAVDAHATAWMGSLLAEFGGPAEAVSASSIAAVLAEAFTSEPVLVAYMRRLLVDGGAAAAELFAGMFEVTRQALAGMTASGLTRPAADPPVLAAFLLINDLALILLRERVATVLGVDPFSREGLTRWSQTVLEVYGRGLFLGPGEGGER